MLTPGDQILSQDGNPKFHMNVSEGYWMLSSRENSSSEWQAIYTYSYHDWEEPITSTFPLWQIQPDIKIMLLMVVFVFPFGTVLKDRVYS